MLRIYMHWYWDMEPGDEWFGKEEMLYVFEIGCRNCVDSARKWCVLAMEKVSARKVLQ